MKRWLPWVALAVVLVVALAAGTRGDGRPPTTEERARSVAASVRCPTCRGQSALESDATAARAVREEIRRRVQAGESDGEIRRFLVSRYGDDILLRPEGHGVAALVWALPVAALVLAVGGLAVAFRRWRPSRAAPVSEDDRRLVERALGEAP